MAHATDMIKKKKNPDNQQKKTPHLEVLARETLCQEMEELLLHLLQLDNDNEKSNMKPTNKREGKQNSNNQKEKNEQQDA